MKRLIIILCLLISMHGFSQTEISKELFPTLAGLQRTVCYEYCGETEEDNSANFTDKQTFDSIFFENDKPYILCNDYLLREEDNKILIYSQLLNKDLVLYDFTLEVGDSLPSLYIDYHARNAMDWIPYNLDVVDYNKDFDGTIYPADTFVVTGISSVTLLDGKKYKKWTFNNGMEYVEAIGMYGGRRNGNFFGLIQEVVVPCHIGTHLVCASKNGQLLYQMDDAEMERLGAECLCQAEQNPENLFPTLWGLQRTDIEEHTTCDGKPYLSDFEEYVTTQMNGKLYLSDGRNYLREENNQVLFCCPDFEIYEDIVLYDWTLEIGDTLPHNKSTVHAESDFIVKNVSTVTLLDGKKYKKWTLACGYEYIEGIGAINGEGYGHYLCLESWVQPGTYIRTCLVCASRNGQLLYKMDEAEMERWGAECLCDGYQSSYKDQWCNQWNILSHGQESDPDEPFPHARTSIYWLSENTVNRNGYEYIPLMCSSSKPNVESTQLVGELRFTEEDKQVYFYYDNTEYLLYDFGAQVGDQLQIFSGINNYNYYDYYETYTHVVTRREYLDDGRIKLTSIPFFGDPVPDDINENNYLSVTWIEGVGSEHGIVHNNINNLPGMGTEWLLCAYRDDECRYTTDDPEYAPLGCVYNEGDVINAVEHVSASTPSVQKIIKEGQLLILRDGKTYNVMGMEIK